MKYSEESGQVYLKQFGWSLDRKVALPDYLDPSDMPENVAAIIQNLNGLTFEDTLGQIRKFTPPLLIYVTLRKICRRWLKIPA